MNTAQLWLEIFTFMLYGQITEYKSFYSKWKLLHRFSCLYSPACVIATDENRILAQNTKSTFWQIFGISWLLFYLKLFIWVGWLVGWLGDFCHWFWCWFSSVGAFLVLDISIIFLRLLYEIFILNKTHSKRRYPIVDCRKSSGNLRQNFQCTVQKEKCSSRNELFLFTSF